jgi:hypothetical protein
MKSLLLSSIFSISIFSTTLLANEPKADYPTRVRDRVSCLAVGAKLRQGGGYSTDHYVIGRLLFETKFDDEKKLVSLRSYMGSLEITDSYADDDSPNKAQILHAYYGLFFGKDRKTNLAPRATVYKDEKYYRFNKLNANITSDSDGGGMWGYFVISKEFKKAHYVFRSGDHMGGTIDFDCSPAWRQ